MLTLYLIYSLALTGLLETAKNALLKPLKGKRGWTPEDYVRVVNLLALLLALCLAALANSTEKTLWVSEMWVSRVLVFASIIVLMNHIWHGLLDLFDALVTWARVKAGYGMPS